MQWMLADCGLLQTGMKTKSQYMQRLEYLKMMISPRTPHKALLSVTKPHCSYLLAAPRPRKRTISIYKGKLSLDFTETILTVV
jgi:hypothetical protein